ncbi:MAG TPA: HTTM domain-containing protein [Myxococcota bacterium]|jgi:uncharacterized membrane protein YphA (DoxX/SURF4 family)
MPSLERVRRAITAWFAAETHPANLAVVRITVFWILFDRLKAGGFRRYVRLPEDLRIPPPGWEAILNALPLDETMVKAVQIAAVACSFLALVGFWTRTAAALSALLGSYVLVSLYLFGKVDHTYHHLIWFALLLAASPSGDALSIDAWLARRRGRPPPGPARAYALPIRLMWLLMGVAYFFPGLYKLLAGPQWIWSDNLRFLLYQGWRHHHMLPLLRLDQHPALCQAAALGTILFELSFIFLVLSRRTRPFAAIGGLLFHAMTAYFLRIYFLELMACYVVFVDWHALARRLGLARGTAPPARAAPNATAAAVVGGLLLAVNAGFGAFGVDSWPFSIYPRFDRVREQAIGFEMEAMIEGEAGSRRLKLPLRGTMLGAIRNLPDGEERDRRLRALIEYTLAQGDRLAPGETVRVYASTYSTLPEDWRAPPLRRELLFDYHAARHVEPRRQP